MTREDKQLLLIEFCARLPYGVQCEVGGLKYGPYTFTGNDIEDLMDGRMFKPYLRPMSSMTDEEKEEYRNIDNRSYSCPIDYAHVPASDRIDWLNAHHFDFRNLIGRGLALKAPNGMYK